MLRWERFAPLAPFGGVVALYLLYREIYDRVGIDGVKLRVPEGAWRSLPGPEAVIADLGARLLWGTTLLAFILAFLATLAVCLRVIWNASSGGVRAVLLGGAVVGAGAGIGAGLVGNPLTLPAVEDLLVRGLGRMGLDDGGFLLLLSNGLAMAAAVLLTFAAAAILVEPPPDKDGPAQLADKARRLRRVLYSGAVVLIAGSVQAAAMHRLPVANLEAPWSSALGSAAQLTAIATGGLWSLFLLAIYVPTALILRVRFRGKAEAALPTGGASERRQWLAAHDLDVSPVEQLKQLLATLGPLLSSLPLAGLFELLAG